jgi:hypothetical protein
MNPDVEQNSPVTGIDAGQLIGEKGGGGNLGSGQGGVLGSGGGKGGMCGG